MSSLGSRRLASRIATWVCAPGRRLAVVLATVVCAALAVGAAPALAEHTFSGSFGEPCTTNPCGPGQFKEPSGVAVNEVTLVAMGDVYVVDKGDNRVERFSAAGVFLGEFEAPPGGFQGPEGIAVDNSENPLDPSKGDVYVVDPLNKAVDKFTAEGVFLNQITTGGEGLPFNAPASETTGLAGVAVDPEGTVWVYQFDAQDKGEVDSYSDALVNAFRSFHIKPPGHGVSPGFAVDSEGNSYGNGLFPARVLKMNSVGEELIEEVDPEESTAVAVDDGNNVYIDNGTSVGEFGPVAGCTALVPCKSNPELLERFGEGHLTAGAGLAVDSATGSVYVADSTADTVSIFTGPVMPAVRTGEATELQSEGKATLNGTVDPHGVTIALCEIEYVSDAALRKAFGHDYEELVKMGYDVESLFKEFGGRASCEHPGAGEISGSSQVPVYARVNGLAPRTIYHFRLLAANANGSRRGRVNSFFATARPSVSGEEAADLTASTATLKARIDPEGLDTRYHVEYGTTTEYGTTVPVPDADVGFGTEQVFTGQPIGGLQANTTYHWRLIAANTAGTITGPDHTFIFDTSGFVLPDNRAYEMVTPPAKNGTLIPPTAGLGMFHPDIAGNGQRVIAAAIGCFGDAESCNANRGILGSPDEFSRTPEGWVATALEPSANTPPGVYSPNIYSADAGTALFNAPTPPGNEDDFYARLPEQPVLDIGPMSSPAGGPLSGGEFLTAATSDLSRVVWQSGPTWEFDVTSRSHSLYEYAGAGNTAPMLVGVSGGPHSTDLLSACKTSLAGETPNALSADGHTVFFTAEGEEQGGCKGSGANASMVVPVNELFARIDNSEADEAETNVRAHTVAISQPNALAPAETEPDAGCTSEACAKSIERSAAPDGNPSWRGAEFAGASADGARVFFTSTQQLTNEASEDSQSSDTAEGNNCQQTTGPGGCNLYLYDFSRPEGHRLIDVSAGDTTHGPQVQGVMGVSSDGSHVYFVAKGELAEAANGQGQVARDGAENLYVFDADTGHATFVAALCSGAGEWVRSPNRAVTATTMAGLRAKRT